MSRPGNPSQAEDLQKRLVVAERRIAELTSELDSTNRGIIALHTELEAAHEAAARVRSEYEVLAERDRIARDLQDQVIHRLFDASLHLQGVAGLIPTPAAARVKSVITELDATIRNLRTTIFALYDQPQNATSLRVQFADLIDRADLGVTPTLQFHGPIDAAVPDHIAADLLAVTGEALAAIGHATAATISLHATGDELILHVDHDGPDRGDLDAMRERAAAHGGTVEVTGRPGAGTRFEWRIPLPHLAEGDEAR